MRVRSVIFSASLVILLICGGKFLLASAATANQNVGVSFTVPSSGGGGGNPPPPDNLPTISNVVSSTSYTTAAFSWDATDDGGISVSTFEYGLTTSYGLTGSVFASYQTSLTNLATGTTYYFRIGATEASGSHRTVYFLGSFQTVSVAPSPSDTTPPIISAIRVVPSITTCSIGWDTNEAADSQINYGLTAGYGSLSTDPAFVLSRDLVLFSLLPNTTYHYRLVSTDVAGNAANTNDATFTTLKDTAPPPDVSSLTVVPSGNSLVVSWTNPSINATPDFSGVKVVRKVGSQSTSVNDGTLVYTGSGETVTDSNVLVNITYFYTVFSFDTSNNFSNGIFASGKIPPPPGQEICTNGVDDDGDGKTDCADSACVNDPSCQGPQQEICNNGIDDDGNGKVDCSDNACSSDPSCQAPRQEICTNGADDDGDGIIDCADSDCVGSAFCQQPPSVREICDNGSDDDGDANIDCADSDCFAFGGCGSVNNPPVTPPTSTVSGTVKINISDMAFLAGNGQIVLVPNNGLVTSLAGSNTTVIVAKAALMKDPVSVIFVINGADQHQLLFNASQNHYAATFAFPPIGNQSAYLVVDYGNGQVDTIAVALNSLPYGNITSSGSALSGAELTLRSDTGAIIPLSLYGEENPFITNPNGTYGWVVPNGRYTITARLTGFYDRTTPVIVVQNNVINASIDLIATPPSLLDVIDPNAPLSQNVKNVVNNLIDKGKAGLLITAQSVTDAGKVVQEIKNNPEVQKTASQVVAPTAVGVVAVGTISLVSWADLLSLLRLLFLQPLLLIGLRRREGWGQVYNALNKLPVDLATIRLINAETGRILQSKVTDQKGRYAFVADPGLYRLEVTKANFIFPSELLKNFKNDGRRPDIYHGESIQVAEEDALITANIPLDPAGEHKTPRRLVLEKLGRRLQAVVSWAGIVVTIVSLYIAPRWYVWVLLGIHLALLLIFRRLAKPPKIKSWGIVYEAGTKRPVAQAVARLFSSQFNKLVATQVTDRKGRYYFLAGDNQYYVTYERPTYETHKTDIIDLAGKEAEPITINVELTKQGAKNPPQNKPEISDALKNTK